MIPNTKGAILVPPNAVLTTIAPKTYHPLLLNFVTVGLLPLPTSGVVVSRMLVAGVVAGCPGSKGVVGPTCVGLKGWGLWLTGLAMITPMGGHTYP